MDPAGPTVGVSYLSRLLRGLMVSRKSLDEFAERAVKLLGWRDQCQCSKSQSARIKLHIPNGPSFPNRRIKNFPPNPSLFLHRVRKTVQINKGPIWLGFLSRSYPDVSVAESCDLEMRRRNYDSPIRTGRVFFPVAWAVSEGLNNLL